jgi:hypothetical protein
MCWPVRQGRVHCHTARLEPNANDTPVALKRANLFPLFLHVRHTSPNELTAVLTSPKISLPHIPSPHCSHQDCSWSDRFLDFQSIFRKRLIHRPDDGGSTHLRNVDFLPRNYTALYLRKLSSSYPHRDNLTSCISILIDVSVRYFASASYLPPPR